jgi:NAD(P)-dependent dehydrogenase (short-subunit alcohol dehydrogenase family)
VFPLTGKTVLITAASEGVGASTARVFGERGARVIAHFEHDRAGAEAAIGNIADERKFLVQGDLVQLDTMTRLWREALAWQDRIHVLVINCPDSGPAGGIDEDQDIWDRAWDLAMRGNVLSPVGLIRHAVRHFRASGGGIVLTMSNWSAMRGADTERAIAVAATHAALRATTQTVARTCAHDNVLAYVVAPGGPVPAGEIARLAAFLASGKCRHLTGATIDVNGASYVR